jgi:hypothetical protein
MRISKIVTDGSARDEALKRRNAAMREVLGMKPAPPREASRPISRRCGRAKCASPESSSASWCRDGAWRGGRLAQPL